MCRGGTRECGGKGGQGGEQGAAMMWSLAVNGWGENSLGERAVWGLPPTHTHTPLSSPPPFLSPLPHPPTLALGTRSSSSTTMHNRFCLWGRGGEGMEGGYKGGVGT